MNVVNVKNLVRTAVGRAALGGAALVVVALAGVAGLGLASCTKTVAFELSLTEPCDQKSQALNGVSSFEVSSSGSDADDAVTFNIDGGAAGAPLAVGLGDAVTITVEAFAGDVTAGGATGTSPQSIGRTMPLAITAQTQDQTAQVLVGKVDSFGKTSAADGSCTTMTTGAPVPGRHGHTATFVPILNKVLIVGGAVWSNGTESFLSTAELYDPATGLYEELPDIGGTRAYHAATAFPNGRVLISGGFGVVSGQVTTLGSALIFDPALGATDPFRIIELKTPRAHHTSTLLAGGALIVLIGGCTGSANEDACSTTQAGAGNHGDSTTTVVEQNQPQQPLPIETVDVGEPTATVATKAVSGAAGLAVGRAFHQATSLENGAESILVITGGANADGPVCQVELFRGAGGALAHVAGAEGLPGFVNPAPPARPICPVRHAAVAIDERRLLVVGGQVEAPSGAPTGPGSANVFFFDSAAGVNSQNPIELFGGGGRVGAVAAELSDGSILVAGGATTPGQSGAVPPTAEVLRPGIDNQLLTAQVLAGPPLPQARDHAALAILPGNAFIFTGGYDATAPPFVTSSSAEIYFGP